MSNFVFALPDAQGYGAWGWPYHKTPRYNTSRLVPASNRGEVAFSYSPYPLWDFDVAIPYMFGNEMDPGGFVNYIINFFASVQGSFDTWLYADPFPNTGQYSNPNYIYTQAPVTFGIGDGSTTGFQIQRPMGPNAFDIVQNLNGANPPNIYINGVLQSSGYTITATGGLYFASAPALSAILTWSGSNNSIPAWYYRCRFNEDSLTDLEQDLYQFWSLKSLKFSSVIL